MLKKSSKKPAKAWDLETYKAWFDGTAKGIMVGLCMLVGFLGKYLIDEFIQKKQQLEEVIVRMEVLEAKLDLIIKQNESNKNSKQIGSGDDAGRVAEVLWSAGWKRSDRPVLFSHGIYFCERPKRLRTAHGKRIADEVNGSV